MKLVVRGEEGEGGGRTVKPRSVYPVKRVNSRLSGGGELSQRGVDLTIAELADLIAVNCIVVAAGRFIAREEVVARAEGPLARGARVAVPGNDVIRDRYKMQKRID
jgi:hypothetical protein